MASFPERSEIDFLILADKAEILNGKLYMMGGGWDRRQISNIEGPTEISMVVGLLVPWNRANEEQRLSISVEHADGKVIEPQINWAVTVGRPAHAAQGQTFRAMAAITGRWTLPGYGSYSVRASLSEATEKSTVFHAVEGQP